jgi:hypothetical protein
MDATIARRLPFAETTEEGLERALDTQPDILQDLAVDLTVLWHGHIAIRRVQPLADTM